jgi:hypothetical protein
MKGVFNIRGMGFFAFQVWQMTEGMSQQRPWFPSPAPALPVLVAEAEELQPSSRTQGRNG